MIDMCKNRTCGTCALKQLQGGVCPIFKRSIGDNEKGCIVHTTQINKCDFCGQVSITPLVVCPTEDNQVRYVCDQCCSLFGTCRTCIQANGGCDFETNPSTLPKVVQKEIRQGNMISRMQVRNPARIDITCKAGCKCWNEENGCLREAGTCGNWKEF